MSDNICVSCGATIPEGLQVCPTCINREKIVVQGVMKWEKLANGDWQAKGKNGDIENHGR